MFSSTHMHTRIDPHMHQLSELTHMQDADALEHDNGVNKVMSSTQRDHNEDKIQFL